MKCHVCGAALQRIVTQVPFRVGDQAIVIIKDSPVLQCRSCPEYLLEDAVMARIDHLLSKADTAAELEIVTYAA
ncbi:MAG: type II toxin-antitoxin system MqsA family antitoxin [Chloroflexi bacterium]|nr:type II toxin-antitoxin system MqsA family antitoxin [Chloroflexota bacterium]